MSNVSRFTLRRPFHDSGGVWTVRTAFAGTTPTVMGMAAVTIRNLSERPLASGWRDDCDTGLADKRRLIGLTNDDVEHSIRSATGRRLEPKGRLVHASR